MKLAQFTKTCARLLAAQDYHKESAAYYHGLFNAVADAGSTEVSLNYTPLQEFYQRQAEYHLFHYFQAKVAETNFGEAAESALLGDEPAQD